MMLEEVDHDHHHRRRHHYHHYDDLGDQLLELSPTGESASLVSLRILVN